jgi:glycerate-2-kinase
VQGQALVVGGAEFEPEGSPIKGEQSYDLNRLGRIYVVGAGKGIQRAALALEDALGEHLTGGHVIDKRGSRKVLRRIGVTFGAHPIPDEECVRGCQCILELTSDLAPNDLVFTVGASGFSSLLTLPVPGITLEDVQRTVHVMQIQLGCPTSDLSPIRNHLDLLKGGGLAARIHPAQAIHIMAKPPGVYSDLIYANTWFHTLPDRSTFEDAIANIRKWEAWDAMPTAVRAFLERADPRYETLKPDQYQQLRYRIYGVLPGKPGDWPSSRARAEALGFRAITLAKDLTMEANQAGAFVGALARAVEREGTPFEPPVALFTSGELLVTVGRACGIGGRNQEYALAAALQIEGSPGIVIGAVDTDGTDGPGGQYAGGVQELPAVAGGLVDGYTVCLARERGLDVREALRRHDTTQLLMTLNSAIMASQNTGLQDLGVVLVP